MTNDEYAEYEDVVEPDVENTEEPEQVDPIRMFFIATVKVLYVRDDKPKERTVNIMMNLAVPYITQATLRQINRAAFERVMKEVGIEPDALKDVIIMNISMLGQMTEKVFLTEDIPLKEKED